MHVFLRITEHYYIIKLSSLEDLSICRSRDFILISCVRLAENDLQIMFSSKRESPKIQRNSQLTIGTKIFCISSCNKFTSITNGAKETTTDCRLLALRSCLLRGNNASLTQRTSVPVRGFKIYNLLLFSTYTWRCKVHPSLSQQT